MFSQARTSLAAAGIATLAAATTAQAAVVVVEVGGALKLTSISPSGARNVPSSQFDPDGDGTNDIIVDWDKAFQVRTLFTRDTKGAAPTGLPGILDAGDGPLLVGGRAALGAAGRRRRGQA